MNDRLRIAGCRAIESRPLSALQHKFLTVGLNWGNPDGSGCWLLVRASNTEPIVRLVAEAPTADGAERLCQEGERVIRAVLNS